MQGPKGSVQYGYDAFGRMVSRTDGNGNTAYFYDGSNVLLAHPTHGSTYLASEYLPGANGQIAGINRLNGSGKPLQSEQYYQRDGQGSVVGLTNNSGGDGPAVPVAAGYDAWSNPSGLVDSDDSYGLPLAYTGLSYDQEATGLTYTGGCASPGCCRCDAQRWYTLAHLIAACRGSRPSRTPMPSMGEHLVDRGETFWTSCRQHKTTTGQLSHEGVMTTVRNGADVGALASLVLAGCWGIVVIWRLVWVVQHWHIAGGVTTRGQVELLLRLVCGTALLITAVSYVAIGLTQGAREPYTWWMDGHEWLILPIFLANTVLWAQVVLPRRWGSRAGAPPSNDASI